MKKFARLLFLAILLIPSLLVAEEPAPPAEAPIPVPLTLPFNINVVSVGTADNYFNMGTDRIKAKEYCAFLNAVASKTDLHHLYNPKTAPATKSKTNDGKTVIIGQGDDRVANITRTQNEDKTFSYTVAPGSRKIPETDAIVANEDLPITHVSLMSAARFCNWMHNGQGGPETTETGAYALDETVKPVFQTITLQPGARWRLPTQDEWILFYSQYSQYDATPSCWEWTMTPHELAQNPLPGHSHYGTYVQVGGASFEPRYNNGRPDQVCASFDTGFRVVPAAQ